MARVRLTQGSAAVRRLIADIDGAFESYTAAAGEDADEFRCTARIVAGTVGELTARAVQLDYMEIYNSGE